VPSAELPDLLDAVVIEASAVTSALAARDVDRFIVIGDLLAVPLAPPWLRGVALVDGAPALVVDVAALPGPASTAGRAVEEARAQPYAGSAPPPTQVAIVCRVEGETVVLVGALVRAIVRLRISARRGSSRAAEWRGVAIPGIDLEGLIADAASSRELR
jgi:chemotaxis signal transduction protein